MQKKIALVFPGQGSQKVGMGQSVADLPEGRAVFDAVDAALGYSLSAKIFQGTDADLKDTKVAQPALMTASMALFQVARAKGVTLDGVVYAAGHSLGEITALCAMDALSLTDAATLLDVRAQAMSHAVPNGLGAMTAVLGLDPAQFESPDFKALSSENAVCCVANDNGAGQVVLSGHKAALENAALWVKEQGGRAISLPVSGPFHTDLMKPAADAVERALRSINVNAPTKPVITNVGATPQTNPDTLKEHLVRQVTGTVRFRETMDFMAAAGVTDVIEIGSGKVLGNLFRRAHPDITVHNWQTLTDIDTYLGA